MVGDVADEKVVGKGAAVAVKSLACVVGVIAERMTVAVLASARIKPRRMLKRERPDSQRRGPEAFL